MVSNYREIFLMDEDWGKLRLPVKSRTSMDVKYLVLIGEVVFLYNIFENTVVDIIDKYELGVREGYYLTYRFNPRDVLRKLDEILKKNSEISAEDRKKLERIKSSLPQAIDLRAAIAHGNVVTDVRDEEVRNRQVFNYQTGDLSLASGKRSNAKNRYRGVLLSYKYLVEECERLEESCSFAREFYNEIAYGSKRRAKISQ